MHAKCMEQKCTHLAFLRVYYTIEKDKKQSGREDKYLSEVTDVNFTVACILGL